MSVENEQHESVHVLMGRALASLPAIGKNSTAPENMGGYKFRGIEDITAALKPVLSEFGLFCIPSTEDINYTERIVGGQYKKTMYCVDVCVKFTFYGPAGDSVAASTYGQGTDMGDKATQKAYTSAFKSMLTIAFLIADEQDDAERHDVPDSEGSSRRPSLDEQAQAQGWASEEERKNVHDALKPGLTKLVEDGYLDKDVAAGLWKGLPKPLPMTKEQFDTWIAGVEQAKAEYAAKVQAAADQVKDATGAEEVETPTA